jgi:hypothetical protein
MRSRSILDARNRGPVQYSSASTMKRTALLCLLAPSLVAGLALAALGCEETTPVAREPVPGTNRAPMPGVGVAPDLGVIEHIAEATCDREQSCGTIGPGSYFASRDACMQSMRDKLGPKLSFSQCPDGLDRAAVDSCVESLRSTQCTQPGDSITRSARCSESDMCMK